MTPEELTAVVTGHQQAISRHDLEMAEIRTTLNTVGQKLNQVAEQQQFNMQAIANLTASLVELRNIVADDITRRSS